MRKLIKRIAFGHEMYLGLILLLAGYVVYQEYRNQYSNLKISLAQNLRETSTILYSYIGQQKIEIIETIEKYPFEQGEQICNRFIHLEQQTNSLSKWIAMGMAAEHKPYFPALKDAYTNQLELSKIYCNQDVEFNKLFSKFNPQITPLRKFDDPLFLEHAHMASLINLAVTSNFCLRKISGIECGFDFYIPYLLFDKLNFTDNGLLEGTAILSENNGGLTRLFPYRKNYHLFLNNQEFPIKNGIAPFHYQFDTPGIYPLQVRWQYNHPETDSVTVFEKTYYVKVDPS